MHPAVIEAWLCDIVTDQLPFSNPDFSTPQPQARKRPRTSPAGSSNNLTMDDGSPTKEPRRSQRGKTSQTPSATAQTIPMRPAPSDTGSPVRRSTRRGGQSNRGASDGHALSMGQSTVPDPESTPRPTRSSSSRAENHTTTLYTRSFSDYQTIFDRPALPSSRSSPSKQSSTSRRSTSPLKTIAALRAAGVRYDPLMRGGELGEAGKDLYADLHDISLMIGVYPAAICQDILEAIDHEHRIHKMHMSDDVRSRDVLLAELSEIQIINQLSQRCSRDMEGEAEWNNAVHSAVLRMALGSDDSGVGWRYITNAKIDSQYLPVMPDGLPSSSKMVDYAMFIGDDRDAETPSQASQDGICLEPRISSLVEEWPGSINHLSYFALRHRPVLLGIETKTIERTEAEARVQLGIWIAAHIRRIWALGNRLSDHKKVDQLRERIQEMVFPLMYVQSAKWSLMFARPSFELDGEAETIKIVIYHDVSMGETSSVQGSYQLLQAFRVLRRWGDEVFREWWGTILEILY